MISKLDREADFHQNQPGSSSTIASSLLFTLWTVCAGVVLDFIPAGGGTLMWPQNTLQLPMPGTPLRQHVLGLPDTLACLWGHSWPGRFCAWPSLPSALLAKAFKSFTVVCIFISIPSFETSTLDCDVFFCSFKTAKFYLKISPCKPALVMVCTWLPWPKKWSEKNVWECGLAHQEGNFLVSENR